MLKSLLTKLTSWFSQRESSGANRRDKKALGSEGTLVELQPVSEESSLVPFDEYLLERSRTQWQFGDWASLARLDRDTIQHQPDRAKLALLAAAGRLQTGQDAEARQFARLAKDWGVGKRLISQILIAGVHNSIGRANAIGNQPHRALQHFENAINIGTPGADSRLLTQARIHEQHSQLGMPQLTLTAVAPKLTFPRPPAFRITTLSEHNLGEAWAGNTINTVIFRHHGILTLDRTQFTAFYVDIQTLRIVKRELNTETISTYDLIGEYNLKDAHNSISLGVDRLGYIHISYDHHATKIRYRRSITPWDITNWSDELPMTGRYEERVTYPTFILPRDGFPLTLLYRDGVHNKGSARLKTYDENYQLWTDHPLPILSGADQKPWTSNPYWNHPAVGTDGSLHLSFVWRTDSIGEEQKINNINIGYACSMDNGLSWQTSLKRPYKLPITQVNTETIYPVPPGSNLINQTSMALDSLNRPHIVFYADDPSGIPQYQHLWFDGKVWHHQIISSRTQPFSLEGRGTLQTPISRPDIVIDHHNNVYIIARGDHTQNHMAATLLPAPDYRYQPNNTSILFEQDLGFSEPVIDRTRWQQEEILAILKQHCQQPKNDIGHRQTQSQIAIIDIRMD